MQESSHNGSCTQQETRRDETHVSSLSAMTSDKRWRNGYGRSRSLTRKIERRRWRDTKGSRDCKERNGTPEEIKEQFSLLYDPRSFLGLFLLNSKSKFIITISKISVFVSVHISQIFFSRNIELSR